MSKPKANLILHPVRLRIVTELARQKLTPRQLAQLLPNVPQATLYRHLSLLLEGGILEVVAEQPVNGATERTYTVAQGQGNLDMAEMKGLSRSEHLQYFTVYATTLIDTFTEYIQNCDLEQLGEDGLAYQRAVVYLSDEERAQFQREVIAVLGRVISQPPAPDRKRYTLSSIVIPEGRNEE